MALSPQQEGGGPAAADPATDGRDGIAVPRILLIDDDPALLLALSEALRLRLGEAEVDAADSAETGLARLDAADYDVVLSDIKMPGMDGIEFLALVRERRPKIPIVLITGHGEQDLTLRALRGGAFDFIAKPIDREYLTISLKRAIHVRSLQRRVDEQQRVLARRASTLEYLVRERTAELERRTREMLEASRAKDTFLSIASHELRTPLTSAKGLAQLLCRRLTRSGAPEAEYAAKMERSLGRMEKLVSDLVDASRIESGKLALRREQVDLPTLARQAVDEVTTSAARAIVVEAPEGRLMVEADPDRLCQVLVNLLSNALRYSPAESPVTLVVRRAGDEALIEVRDMGIGIAPEEAEHIFERFYRAPDTTVQSGSAIGLGLGLYISREIVERHGGRIWAEGAPGGGSVFSVALSLVAPDAPSAPGAPVTPRGHAADGRDDRRHEAHP